MTYKSQMKNVLSIDQAEEYFKNGTNGFYVYHNSRKDMIELFDLADRYKYLVMSTVYVNVSQLAKRN